MKLQAAGSPGPADAPHPSACRLRRADAPDAPPGGTEWLHEIKYDAYRTELTLRGKDVHAYTRNGHNWTEKYGPVGACSFTEIGKLNLARFAELPGDWRRRQGWFTPDAQPSLNSAAQVVGSRTDRLTA